MSEPTYISAIREEVDRQRARLKLLEESLAALLRLDAEVGRVAVGGGTATMTVKRRTKSSKSAGTFGPQPGGPTETAIAVLRSHPQGIALTALLDDGLSRMNTQAKDARASLRETVRTMRKKGAIERKPDEPGGKYYLKS